jgi:hypothetical protein
MQGCKDILEHLEADGNCKMLEQDVTGLIHEVRRRRRKVSTALISKFDIEYNPEPVPATSNAYNLFS